MRLLFTVVAATMEDDLMNYAAALAYYFLFALFPLLLLIASLAGALHLSAVTRAIAADLYQSLPHGTAVLLSRQLHQLLAGSHGGLLSLGTALTLYSASQGFAGLIAALNRAYEVPETRPYWHVELLALGLTLSAGVMIIIALGALLVGRRLVDMLTGATAAGHWLAAAWPLIRWVVVVGFFILAIALLYHTAPNLKHSGRGLWPAALTTFAIWIAISIGLAVYVDHFANFNAVYGTLGAVIVLMLWFYLLALALLLGAELHGELRRRAGLPREPKQPVKA